MPMSKSPLSDNLTTNPEPVLGRLLSQSADHDQITGRTTYQHSELRAIRRIRAQVFLRHRPRSGRMLDTSYNFRLNIIICVL